jgi:hypothetical protein
MKPSTTKAAASKKRAVAPARAKRAKASAAASGNATVVAGVHANALASVELDTYLTLLGEIWTDVHPLIGAVTLSALFKSAVRRLTPSHPCIAGLQLSADGVDQAAMRHVLASVPVVEASTALRDLVRDLLALFESIAGPVIVRLLLPKIVRAERGAGQPAF